MSAFRKLPSAYVFSYFPFGFEGRMWDLIVSVPGHCLSFYFSLFDPRSRQWLSLDYDVFTEHSIASHFQTTIHFIYFTDFGFLISIYNVQIYTLFILCLNLDILGYLQNRIIFLWQLPGQIQLVQLFWENLYLGISCILVICFLTDAILSLCTLGVMVTEDCKYLTN